MDSLNFRISSALKNIIGKELITDKYVAIFELVKNAYDASAERVDVIFKDDKIIIKDNGKGMSLDDIKNKWLFVGYSAKADNTENEGYVNYRNKIQAKRTFAGAKGVGRFACDRLGSKLRLISKKDAPNSTVESLTVLWDDFEMDSKKEFMDIKVTHESLPNFSEFGDECGTILEIISLREDWADEDVEKLKTHLSRLINPNSDSGDIFNIYMDFHGKIETEEDRKIENFIFEKLGIKTTQIKIEIGKTGEFITTELIDRGERIYKISEKNPWKNTLHNINFTLFYLNRPAKAEFTKTMGIRASLFGSISLYKNGFRVFPFGEPGEDLLKIDNRKTQGYARYLGTRELFGKIEINNSDPNFRETTSRDGGLIETKAYKDLREAFLEICLKRLEAYVVGALDWTFKDEDIKEGILAQEFFPEDRTEKIKELVNKLTRSKDYVKMEYGYGLEEKIKEQAEKGYMGATEIVKEEAKKTGNKMLGKAVKRIEETQKRQEEEITMATKKIEQIEEQNSALKVFVDNPFFKTIADYHHDISIATSNIQRYTTSAMRALRSEKYSELELTIINIQTETEKINSISKIATRSGIQDGVHKKPMAINKKIEDYVNDYLLKSGKLKVSISSCIEGDFIVPFRYFDIVTVIDNLVDNSKKNGAENFKIQLIGDPQYFEVSFSDDGNGLDPKFKNNPEEIFEPKISTTNGAGWGLTQVRDILQKMGGEISVIPKNEGKGIVFKIIFISGK